MPPKRTLDDIDEILNDFRLPDGWAHRIIDHPDAAVLLEYFAQEAGITDWQHKRARLALPSFSQAKWKDVGPSLGLSEIFTAVKFEKFSPPMCLLPPSLHRGLYEGGWRIMDVYQERVFQHREACKVKLLEPWLEPILALFEGRVVDMPESAMSSTHFSATGAVEHEIFIVGGVIFLVVELKFTVDGDDNFAQLFLELASAARINKSANYANLRVFGLLTDVSSFQFYSYDPSLEQFHRDEIILVNAKRDDFCYDMIQVSNKIFSVTMYAYMEVLRGTVQSSQRRSDNGDLSPTGSSPIQQLTKTPSVSHTKVSDNVRKAAPRVSLTEWQRGLEFAEEAYKKLQEVSTDMEQLERIATDGLDLLARSVHCFPRLSDSSSEKNPSTAKELRAVAEEKVKEWHEKFFRRQSDLIPSKADIE